MIRRLVALSLAASLLAVLPARGEIAPPTAAELADHVAVLASTDMDGRRSGTPGGERAARQIAEWLRVAGLLPGGGQGTFFQSFIVETGTRLAPGTTLDVVGPGVRRFEAGREWTPHGGSVLTEVSGEVVFVGYGVVALDERYDDYTGIDVRGKIALALDGTPAHLVGRRHSRLDKVLAAREHGARALLLAGDTLPSLDATAVPVDLVSAALIRGAADALLAPSGRTMEGLARAITASRGPASFATGVSARVAVDLEREDRRAANVVGVLPGTDPTLAAEAVVIGAHYDHLGRPNGVLHPGADDNASGTALVVGLARAFAAGGRAPRTLVFALFAGEELGMLGSTHYVRQSPMTQTVAMLNFDMVGRLRGDRVHVGGVDSGSGLRALVSEAARGARLAPTVRGSPYEPSDHLPFYAAGVPAFFFTTGAHRDFHRPTDTADKIDADGMERVAVMAARLVERLASAPRPVYAKVPDPERPRWPGGGVFFGVAADGRAPADGVQVARILPDSPAARAGVREGDVIVRFAGVPVDSLDELRTVLRRARPGDTVRVVYLRGGIEHETSAMLEARP